MTPQDGGTRREVAETPHPRRLVQIARLKPGTETAVRSCQARFPVAAAAAAGLAAVEAFIGSGYYVVLYELGEGATQAEARDFQAVFAQYMNDPAVQEYHRELAQVLEDFPAAGQHYGPGEAAGAHISSGALHLAAGMFHWRVGTAPQFKE